MRGLLPFFLSHRPKKEETSSYYIKKWQESEYNISQSEYKIVISEDK
jgi:hypothetical protein